MNKSAYKIVGIIICTVLTVTCRSQNNKEDKTMKDKIINRQPAVAGQFYPGSETTLKDTLKQLFSRAKPSVNAEKTVAVLSPHAGYPFSGEVAASSFNQVSADKAYDNIFIISSSHQVSFSGSSIYHKGNYITPLGEAPVNIPLAKSLTENHDCFEYFEQAHLKEHSLEVQLPFLQYKREAPYQVIPIVIGTHSPDVCKEIANALSPYFNENNLFIISTDFSHYPSYSDAIDIDKKTAAAVLSKEPDNLLSVINTNSKKNIPNLATSMCGWTSVLTLLYMIEENNNITAKEIQYMNSGHSPYGEKNRVVGYYSIAFMLNNPASDDAENHKHEEVEFTNDEKKQLLDIARHTIVSHISEDYIPELDANHYPPALKKECGAFVTLHKDDKLRGCIGQFEASKPLYELIQAMAISASTSDPRFPAVKAYEIDKLDIEISVLTPMKKINSIDEIELGKHGIYIKKGRQSGTFLPQVATETGWTKEEFLGHCARDKARIGWDGWKNADIYTYKAIIFSEKEME